MTATQLIMLGITVICVLLGADLLRLAVANRRKRQVEVNPGFRRVGTYGSLKHFDPTPEASFQSDSQGGGYAMLLAGLLLLVFVVGGIVFKMSWDAAHPDIRTRYGRDFERCIAEEGISRWQVAEVEKCIRRAQVR